MSTSLLTADEAARAMTLSPTPSVLAPDPGSAVTPYVATGVSRDWRRELPTIVGKGLTLRGLRLSDAASLLEADGTFVPVVARTRPKAVVHGLDISRDVRSHGRDPTGPPARRRDRGRTRLCRGHHRVHG